MNKVKVDGKGRISLGKLAEGVSSFQIEKRASHLILTPLMEVPVHEAWLYKNPEALKSVVRGIKDSKAGLTQNLNAKYLEIAE